MMKRSTFARSTLAALLALAVTPVPAAGPEQVQQRTQSENQYRYMGDAPTGGDINRNAGGGLNRGEVQTQQQQREMHQQQQRQQQMYQERMNMGGPGGMGMGQGHGQGGGRR
jgi:hypothetical protein